MVARATRSRRTRARTRSATAPGRSTALNWAARIGLTARGIVYVLIGLLAFLLARGARGTHVDQKGALSELLSWSYGRLAVTALAIGFLCYALWRISEAAYGVAGDRSSFARMKSLARGIVYLALTVTALAVLQGTGQSQSHQQETFPARALSHAGGRLLVVLFGLVVVAAGLSMIVEGWKLKFMKNFRGLPADLRPTIVVLGRIGTIGRGLVFALIGAFIVVAGWSLDAHRSDGMDGAFRTLLAQPFGAVLGVAAALALIAFGIFGLAEARYRRV
jgi:Mn2+/Fe2+ NRAMP family transporter